MMMFVAKESPLQYAMGAGPVLTGHLKLLVVGSLLQPGQPLIWYWDFEKRHQARNSQDNLGVDQCYGGREDGDQSKRLHDEPWMKV